MSTKWYPHYQLNAQTLTNATTADGSIVAGEVIINDPLTMEFNITRAKWSSQGDATIRVRNLNPNTRLQVYKDWQDPVFRTLKLAAGYGNPTWPYIFNGHINECYSYKDSGSTDFITEWTGWDFAYVAQTAMIHQTLTGSPLTKQYVINTLVNNLIATPNSLVAGNSTPTGLKIGYISKFPGTYPTNKITFMGSTWNYLQRETGNKAFIDNGVLNILKDFDVIAPYENIPVINADMGLLSSPKKTEAFLNIDILFEPSIQCGQLISLQSTEFPEFNGQYQVLGLEHKGIISGSINGKRTTSLEMLFELENFNQLKTTGLPQNAK